LANASLTPDVKATATVTPPALDSGYVVQVASVRSETGAQAAFRELQAKYPQLGSRQAIIRPVDLGAAGTYYRALVGPFTSAKEATRLCRSLKGAGADCIIQKN
jgi:cell division septation protein DedD